MLLGIAAILSCIIVGLILYNAAGGGFPPSAGTRGGGKGLGDPR
jgi:hypothetical protein